jgi:hypothetical protein
MKTTMVSSSHPVLPKYTEVPRSVA